MKKNFVEKAEVTPLDPAKNRSTEIITIPAKTLEEIIKMVAHGPMLDALMRRINDEARKFSQEQNQEKN